MSNRANPGQPRPAQALTDLSAAFHAAGRGRPVPTHADVDALTGALRDLLATEGVRGLERAEALRVARETLGRYT